VTAQITMRFPSVITYAYTEVTGTAEELGRINPEMVAALFANAMFVYGKAERAAMERLKGGQTALLPAPHGPAEEKSHEEYEKLLKEELGASEVAEDDDGYKPEPKVAPKKKAWETDKPKSATLNIDFDDF